MKQPDQRKRTVLILLIAIASCFICDYASLPPRRWLAAKFNFADRSPEEIFHIYILDRKELVSPEVSQIHGVEGTIFGYLGPVFIRFEATNNFINEMLAKQINTYSPYSLTSCQAFFAASSQLSLVQEFPEKFDWWRPAEINAPVCYQAQGSQADNAIYFLIDHEKNFVYFYHTATCGLCPD